MKNDKPMPLDHYMKIKGYNQETLAEVMGATRWTVSRLLAGRFKRRPHSRIRDALCRIFDLTPYRLHEALIVTRCCSHLPPQEQEVHRAMGDAVRSVADVGMLHNVTVRRVHRTGRRLIHVAKAQRRLRRRSTIMPLRRRRA